MADLHDDVLAEAGRRGETLLLSELVELIERHHDDGRPGVDRSLAEAYVRELSAGETGFRVEDPVAAIDGRLASDDAPADEDALHEVADGRVSAYPSAWHERLGGETDVATFVRELGSDEETFTGWRAHVAGAGGGIPEQPLLDAVATVGGLSREEADRRLDELRREGVLVEDADQYPNARVRLAEEDEEFRDGSLE